MRSDHRFDGVGAYNGDIKPVVLLGFADFDNHRAFLGDAAAAHDGLIRPFHRFNGKNRLFLDDNGLADIQPAQIRTAVAPATRPSQIFVPSSGASAIASHRTERRRRKPRNGGPPREITTSFPFVPD